MLAACAPAQPTLTSKELIIYSFSAYIPQTVIAGFETLTGVKVTLEEYASNEEMLAQLEAYPGKYDLIVPSDYTVELLIKQDQLRPIDLATVPNYNNIGSAFLSPYFDPGGATGGRRSFATDNQKYSLPYQWGTTGIAYDPSKVNPPITSWSDLWRPELQGHLVVLDDARELVGTALLVLGHDKNSTDPAQIAAACDKLQQLAPGIIAYDSEQPEKALLTGEAWAGVVFNGNAALATRQNPAITYVFPAEGAGIWFDNLAIPLEAPHADAALAFISFALTAENGAEVTRQFPYSNPNRAALRYLEENDTTLYQQYQSSPASNPPLEAVNQAKPNKNLQAETSQLYLDCWQRVKAGSN